MTRESVIIDGVDISVFGMFILKGGDYDFLSFPERKSPEQNDWYERDGVDADLSEIYFKEKKVEVSFYIKADTADDFLYRLNSFYDLISSPGNRELYSREFDRTFSLRFVSSPAYSHKGRLYKKGTKRSEIKVEFSMDDPLQLFSGSENQTPGLFGSFLGMEDAGVITTEDSYLIDLGDELKRKSSYVKINGYDLSEFGIIVNQCYDTLLKVPAVKPPLTRSFDHRSGLLVYPQRERIFDVKQVNIDCTMIANSRTEFYYNYKALFNNLAKTGTVSLDTYLGSADCYYLKMEKFKKLKSFSDRIIVTFSLSLVLTSPGLTLYMLSSENDFFMITEDNEYLLKL